MNRAHIYITRYEAETEMKHYPALSLYIYICTTSAAASGEPFQCVFRTIEIYCALKMNSKSGNSSNNASLHKVTSHSNFDLAKLCLTGIFPWEYASPTSLSLPLSCLYKPFSFRLILIHHSTSPKHDNN